MGFYIDRISMDQSKHEWHLPPFGKITALLGIPGAHRVAEPVAWVPDLVCVVKNPQFEAALYIHDKRELERARSYPGDTRPRIWLIVPGAADLSGYTEVMAKL